MAKPLIGITGPDRRLKWGWWAASMAIRLAGGRPLRITPANPHSNRRLNGIIIGGGSDIDPLLYGGKSLEKPQHDAARDSLELRMIKRAWQRRIPILGICRGAQLLNVTRGGTLVPDLRGRRRITSNRPHLLPLKTLRVKGGSRLHRVLGSRRLKINSLHHQAIDQVGRELRVVGRDLDRIVQAVEAPRRRFVIGVQWHPEYIPQRSSHRRLFKALVRASRRPG